MYFFEKVGWFICTTWHLWLTVDQYPQSTSWSWLDWHPDHCSVNTQINTWSKVGWWSANSYTLIKIQGTVDWLLTKISIDCQFSVNWGVNGVLIEDIDRHLLADVFSPCNPTFVSCFITLMNLLPGITWWNEHRAGFGVSAIYDSPVIFKFSCSILMGIKNYSWAHLVV